MILGGFPEMLSLAATGMLEAVKKKKKINEAAERTEAGLQFKLKLGGALQLPLAFFTNLINI